MIDHFSGFEGKVMNRLKILFLNGPSLRVK